MTSPDLLSASQMLIFGNSQEWIYPSSDKKIWRKKGQLSQRGTAICLQDIFTDSLAKYLGQ